MVHDSGFRVQGSGFRVVYGFFNEYAMTEAFVSVHGTLKLGNNLAF
jgi:hypothetical protein